MICTCWLILQHIYHHFLYLPSFAMMSSTFYCKKRCGGTSQHVWSPLFFSVTCHSGRNTQGPGWGYWGWWHSWSLMPHDPIHVPLEIKHGNEKPTIYIHLYYIYIDLYLYRANREETRISGYMMQPFSGGSDDTANSTDSTHGKFRCRWDGEKTTTHSSFDLIC